jgi:hypothetical protein
MRNAETVLAIIKDRGASATTTSRPEGWLVAQEGY